MTSNTHQRADFKKKQARKMYQRTRKTIYKTEYNKLNNQVKNNIKRIKRNDWEIKCNNLNIADNQTTTWKQLKAMLGLKPPSTKYPTLITTDKEGTK